MPCPSPPSLSLRPTDSEGPLLHSHARASHPSQQQQQRASVASLLPSDSLSHVAASAAVASAPPGEVATVLQQLAVEQGRLREEVSRQSEAMQRLASEAQRAMADRDEAWRELGRVRQRMGAGGGGAAGGAGPGLDTLPGTDHFAVVNTHLVPKTLNVIPESLPVPVDSQWLPRGLTDPGPNGSPMAQAGRGYGEDGGGGGGFLPGLATMGMRPGSRIPKPPGLPRGPGADRNMVPGGDMLPPLRLGRQDPPPQSRYNSFFSFDDEMLGGDLGGQQQFLMGPQAAMGQQAGAVGPGGQRGGPGPAPRARQLQPLRPPQSPAILRGGHLASPQNGGKDGGGRTGSRFGASSAPRKQPRSGGLANAGARASVRAPPAHAAPGSGPGPAEQAHAAAAGAASAGAAAAPAGDMGSARAAAGSRDAAPARPTLVGQPPRQRLSLAGRRSSAQGAMPPASGQQDSVATIVEE